MIYQEAKNLEEIFNIIKESSSPVRFLAGGMDLMYRFKKGFLKKDKLTIIQLNQVDELKGIQTYDGGIKVGSLTTLTEIQNYIEGKQGFEILSYALGFTGSKQVRNLSSIGGHIASCIPFSHIIPVLMAMGATIEVQSEGNKKTLPLGDLFKVRYQNKLIKGEIITSITIPVLKADRFFYWGEGDRGSLFIAPLIAVMIENQGKYEVYSGHPKKLPCRMESLCDLLDKGEQDDKELLKAALDNSPNTLDDFERALWTRFVRAFASGEEL